MSGATEATLQDLLITAQAMNVNISRLNNLVNNMGGGGTGGGGGTAGATGGMAGFTRAISPASVALGALKGAANLVTSAFGAVIDFAKYLVQGIVATIKNVYSFSAAVADGTAKVADFYRAFSSLPLGLGTLASITADLIAFQERMLESYQRLTLNGAAFAGSLTNMKMAAQSLGLNTSELANIMEKNSEVFAKSGLNVQTGLDRFVAIHGQVMGRFGRQLLNMGFTFESAAQATADFMRVQGSMNKQDFANTALMSKAAVDYTREMDLLVKITGKRKQQIEDEVREIAENELFQQLQASVGAVEAGINDLFIKVATQVGGKDLGTRARTAILTGVVSPLTDAGKTLSAFSQGADMRLLEQGLAAKRSATNIADFNKMFLTSAGNFTKGLQQTTVPFKDVMSIMQAQGKGSFESVMAGLAFNRNLKDINQTIIDTRRQQATQAAGTAGALTMAQKNIRDFAESLLMMVSNFITPLRPILESAIRGILEVIRKLLISEQLNKIVRWIGEAFSYLSEASSPRDLWNRTLKKLNEAFSNSSEVAMGLWNVVKGPIQYFFERALTFIMEFVKEFIFGGPNSDLVKAQKRIYEEEAKVRAARENLANASPEQKRAAENALALAERRYQNVMPSLRREEREALLAVQAKAEADARYREERWRQLNPPDTRTLPMEARGATRSGGTIGMTGNWWEKETQNLTVHQGETVATKEQIAQLIGGAGQKGMAQVLEQVNTTNQEVIGLLKEIASNGKRQIRVTSGLSPNVWNAVS